MRGVTASHLVDALSAPCWPSGKDKRRGLVQSVLHRLGEVWSFLQRCTLQPQRRVPLPTEPDMAEAPWAAVAPHGEQGADRALVLLPPWCRRPR